MALYIPGPVDVRNEVLQDMAHAPIGHRSAMASSWQAAMESYMQAIWRTEKEIIVSTSSGTGLMEGALSSTVQGKLGIVSQGAFGDRFVSIAKGQGLDYEALTIPWGDGVTAEALEEFIAKIKPEAVTLTHNETSTGVCLNLEALAGVLKAHPEILWIVDSVSATGGAPLKVDEWGIDIAITSTQKSLGLPPGMAFCTFSPKARERAEKKPHRGYYFDLLHLADYQASHKEQYAFTPNLSLMAAAVYQLAYIVEKEGIENREQRHRELQAKVGEWVESHGNFFAQEAYRSPTVTVITMEDAESIPLILQAMKEKGFQLAAGYGKLKSSTFRIGHMGDRTLEELETMLETLTTVVETIGGTK